MEIVFEILAAAHVLLLDIVRITQILFKLYQNRPFTRRIIIIIKLLPFRTIRYKCLRQVETRSLINSVRWHSYKSVS